ncbi:MAG: TonB-dependent receptor [Bacteroidales bacterium]
MLLNSGQKIEGGCPNRMDPATAHTELENTEQIDVIKGPYMLRYGPSFGGMIDMQSKNHDFYPENPIHVRIQQSWESNWNGNKEFASVFGNYKWIYYNIYGSRKKYDNYQDGNGNSVDSEFSKYDIGGRLGFKITDQQSILLSYQDANGRDVSFPALPMDERKDDTQLSSFDYLFEDLQGILKKVKMKLYHSKVRHEMDNKNRPFSDTVVAVSVIDAINMGGRMETMFEVYGGALIGGLDYEQILKDGTRTKSMILQPGLPVKVENLWNNAKINNTGLFADYSKTIKNWEFIGAVRLDFNQADSDSLIMMHPMQGEIYKYAGDSIKSSFTNISFSLGATKQINNYWSISLAAGRGVRSPDMTERYITLLPIGYDKYDYLGDPQLEPEANNQVDLTFKYSNPGLGQLQVNGFYSLVNNFITGKRLPPSIQKPLSKDVLGVKQFYNAGNAQLRGFEVSYLSPAKYKLEVAGFASWTYGTIDESIKYIINDAGQVVDDEVLKNDAITEIPPFEASFDLHYKLAKGKFIPRLTVRGVAAQNHVSEANYENPSPGFILTSVSVAYNFLNYFRLSVGVKNLFDVAYYEHLNRSIIGSDINLFEPGRSFYFNLLIDL